MSGFIAGLILLYLIICGGLFNVVLLCKMMIPAIPVKPVPVAEEEPIVEEFSEEDIREYEEAMVALKAETTHAEE